MRQGPALVFLAFSVEGSPAPALRRWISAGSSTWPGRRLAVEIPGPALCIGDVRAASRSRALLDPGGRPSPHPF